MPELRFSLRPAAAATTIDRNPQTPNRTTATIHVMDHDQVAASLAVRLRTDDIFFVTNLTHSPLRQEDVRTTGVVPSGTVDVITNSLVSTH
jgi:hypothetical protein